MFPLPPSLSFLPLSHSEKTKLFSHPVSHVSPHSTGFIYILTEVLYPRLFRCGPLCGKCSEGSEYLLSSGVTVKKSDTDPTFSFSIVGKLLVRRLEMVFLSTFAFLKFYP